MVVKQANWTDGPTDGVAAAVHDFYERHPYPGAVDQLGEDQAETPERQARKSEHHLFWPKQPFREDRSILIAGCGTIQAARHARRWPRARVVGIDVSEASLDKTRLLRERHGLDNLELKRLPVEQAEQLAEQFDQIICTGVLHHLPDPDAGLRALRSVLAPRGAMHLMVYAPYGRAGIYLIQQYGRLLGLASTPSEIRDLMTALENLPKGHPLWPLLQKSPDFQYDSGIADALLHPQDRPYSVPQFLAFAARNGLRFGRWMRQAPYLPYCGAPRGTPHQRRLADLAPSAQYAAMELFRGTMLRHSAILYRDDEADHDEAVTFEGEAWLGYVPIRMPGTLCVEERLPPGKAGVLINSHHTDTDIYLPITAPEKRVVEAIDGELSIAALVKGKIGTEPSRVLFQRLWHHDQVVFDTSHQP